MTERLRLAPFWASLMFGLTALTNVVAELSFATIRVFEMVQLLTVILCFGVVIMALVVFRGTPEQIPNS